MYIQLAAGFDDLLLIIQIITVDKPDKNWKQITNFGYDLDLIILYFPTLAYFNNKHDPTSIDRTFLLSIPYHYSILSLNKLNFDHFPIHLTLNIALEFFY